MDSTGPRRSLHSLGATGLTTLVPWPVASSLSPTVAAPHRRGQQRVAGADVA